MNRKEAEERGWDVHETQHSMKRRSRWHDYHRKGTYMLTLVVAGRAPLFGQLVGHVELPAGHPDGPRVELSHLGRAILNEELQKITEHYPLVEVWKACAMPDHLHLIVRVKEDMPAKVHLGQVVAGFKGGCSRAARRLGVTVPGASAVDARARADARGTVTDGGKLTPLFEPGYNDKILLRDDQLPNWKAYLDDNPRRLLVKRMNPELFTVRQGMEVAGKNCQTVGNQWLLDVPDKVAVIVHRRYSPEERAKLREEWLACGERGGVLVSAAIAPDEKAVLREAMERGYRIILLRENGFSPLYKPAGESFDKCAAGLLLQISPWAFHMEQQTITREQCLMLNDMAERIVVGTGTLGATATTLSSPPH